MTQAKHVGILGGSRFIGHHLTWALVGAGHSVTLFNRGITRTDEPLPPVRRIIGDRNAPDQVAAFLRERYDVVIDLTAYVPGHVEALGADAVRERIGHYVLCSTSSVYRVPAAVPCYEHAPLDRSAGTYGDDKARTEDLVLAAHARTGWPVTIVRAHGVFGPLDAAQPGVMLSHLLQRHPIVLGRHHRAKMNLLFVHDLVRVFLRIIETDVSHGQVYNVAGGEATDQRTLAEQCGAAASLPTDIRLPRRWPYRHLSVGVTWPQHDLILDTTHVRDDLRLAFTPLIEGLRITLAWLREDRRRLHHDVSRAERFVRRDGSVPLWARAALAVDDGSAQWRVRHVVMRTLRGFRGRTPA
jgi:2'-hydroxyisoflavone reductase